LSGGGTVTWTGSYVKWSNRVIAIPVERTEFGSGGYIDINTPTSGTITYYNSSGTTTTVTCTADGIPMAVWEGLWYQVTPGQSSTSDQTKFRLVNYQNSTWAPGEGWLLLATTNGDGNGHLRWLPGQVNLPTTGSTVTYNTGTGKSSWDIGPSGPTGPQGPIGPIGPIGPAGPSTAINATNTTTASNVYLVGVTSTGSNQTPYASTSNFVYMLPSTGSLYGSGTVDFSKFIGVGGDTSSTPSFSWTEDTDTGMYRPADNNVGITAGGNIEFLVYTTYTLSPGSSRAPIFYDSGNTGYYCDPASTTRLNTVFGNLVYLASANGYKYGFYASTTLYTIGMSTSTDTTNGGRVAGETTSDYNMYFTMSGGTNRGFVFRNSNSSSGVVAGIDASGNARFIGDVVAYSSSDSRLKENIKPIKNALEKLLRLGGYEFDWNNKQTAWEEGKHDVGVIAQEVMEVLPEAVNKRVDGYFGVEYDKIVPLLIEAIKEQQKQIDELKLLIESK
jgi:hypothetical protein